MNTQERSDLAARFEQFWVEIRSFRLYSGQPRSQQSVSGVSLAHDALRLATEAEDDGLMLEAWRMLAYSLTANEQYGDALPYYHLAISRCEERNDHALASRLRIGYTEALSHAGRYDDALNVAKTAEQWFTDSGDNLGYARLCTNVANVYFRLDQHARAQEYYTTSAEVFEATGNREMAAQTYQNMGCALSKMDRFDDSDAAFERAEQMSTELHLPELRFQASYNRAYLCYLRGRYSDALQGFGRLREHFQTTGSLLHAALCDLDETEIYLQLNLSKDAAALSSRAAEQFQQIGMSYEEAKAWGFFGVALMKMRRFSEALETFRRSQQAFAAEGNQYWIAMLDLYRADVFLSLERYWEAHALAGQAQKRFQDLQIPSHRMHSLVLLGRIALALKNNPAVEGYAREISSIIKDTRAPLVLFPYHVLCGEIAERRTDWAEAEREYSLAAQDLELNQARIQLDDVRVTFLHGRHQVYESLVRLSLERGPGGMKDAYAWCERTKSRGLVELLSHHMPAVHLRAEQSLLRRVNRLREELNLQYVSARPETRADLAAPDFQAMATKEQELARTLREVALNDPEYVSLQQVRVAELDDVRRFVPERTTIIEYFSTPDEVIAFVISRGGARVYRRLAPPSRIRTLQERLVFQLEKFQLGNDYVQAHGNQIQEATRHYLQLLHGLLIEPLIAKVTSPQLTIIPHGTLHSLPFHALFDGSQYLIDQFEVAYAPSASVLHYCMAKPEVAGTSPLILGVADDNAPMVDEEVRALAAVLPDARLFQGTDATRAAFSHAAQRASSIHVATHMTFRQDNPMFSSFKLADGYVTALDLFSMNCQTNLVTLSGCQSGMGEVSGSDDLLGLMRGFLYAGARSLLLSLWNVSDESTVALMTSFYKEWKGGAGKARALQVAMQTVRKAYPNPFYWAPFILVGKVE